MVDGRSYMVHEYIVLVVVTIIIRIPTMENLWEHIKTSQETIQNH